MCASRVHRALLCAMKPPLDMRPMTDTERAALEAGRRSQAAFTARRGQLLLASAASQTPSSLAKTWHCAPHTVRNALHACDRCGRACVPCWSTVPLTIAPVLHAETRERWRAILHPSPRTFGQPARVWTLKRLAAVCHEQGLSDTPLSGPTRLDAMARLGGSWQRAKPWLVSPDPAYERQQTPRPVAPAGRQAAGQGAGLRKRSGVEP